MLYADFYSYLSSELNYSPRTVKSYTEDLEQFRLFCKEHLHAEDPGAVLDKDLRLWVASLSRQGLEASTVRRKISAVRSFYNYLTNRYDLPVNPAQRLRGPKVGKPLPAFIPATDTKELMDSYASDDSADFIIVRDELMVAMLYNTGIRASELVGLQDKNVDTIRCELKVLGKRNKERVIPFGSELKTMIENYRALRTAHFNGHLTTDFFVRPNGDAVYYHLVYRVVRAALDSSGVRSSRRSPHVLRHSFATDMLNNGADIAAVQKLLGHASLSTTQHYTHLSYKELQQNYKLAHPRATKKD